MSPPDCVDWNDPKDPSWCAKFKARGGCIHEKTESGYKCLKTCGFCGMYFFCFISLLGSLILKKGLRIVQLKLNLWFFVFYGGNINIFLSGIVACQNYFSRVSGGDGSQECKPTKGPVTGKACIFPFTKNGKTCPGPACCNLDEDPKGAWCSTKVDDQGVHVTDNYAYCEGSPCEGISLFYKKLAIRNRGLKWQKN